MNQNRNDKCFNEWNFDWSARNLCSYVVVVYSVAAVVSNIRRSYYLERKSTTLIWTFSIIEHSSKTKKLKQRGLFVTSFLVFLRNIWKSWFRLQIFTEFDSFLKGIIYNSTKQSLIIWWYNLSESYPQTTVKKLIVIIFESLESYLYHYHITNIHCQITKRSIPEPNRLIPINKSSSVKNMRIEKCTVHYIKSTYFSCLNAL